MEELAREDSTLKLAEVPFPTPGDTNAKAIRFAEQEPPHVARKFPKSASPLMRFVASFSSETDYVDELMEQLDRNAMDDLFEKRG